MISVIMAAYNGEAYIEKQLESILTQSVLPDEILIGDDGSSDRTAEIAERILTEFCSEKKKIGWKVIRHESNVGVRENFYELLGRANGELVFLCDQDDIWLDCKVEKMQDVFLHNSKVKALSTTFSVIDGDDRICKQGCGRGNLLPVSHQDFLRYPAYPGMTMCVTKDVIEKTLDVFREHKAMHDWALNYVASSMNGMYLLEKPLTLYRRHSGNVSAMLEMETKEKRKQKREQLVKELIANFTEAGEAHNREWISFEKKRLALLESGNTAKLLGQELSNYRYTKLKPIVGDLFSLL